MRIPERVFVVTGGGDGIGRETVLQLLDRGARVAAVDVRGLALAETAALAGAAAPRLSVHTVDLTDRAAVLALPEAVVGLHGQVDGIVNIAGIIQRFVAFNELTFEEIDRVMDVNFWGTATMVKVFLPLLLDRP